MELTNDNSISTLLKQALQRIDEVSKAPNGITGVPSGYKELDRLTQGWQPSDFIIIASRPGMGKTALALSLARNASVDFKQGVLYFSLDKSSSETTNRILSVETEISTEKIRRATLQAHELTKMNSKIEGLSNAPFYIDDTAFFSVEELCESARAIKEKHNIKLIIVDSLQQLYSGLDNERAKHICISLKKLAKELRLPVIALSQLPRSVEKRKGDKRPHLIDLREMGIPEQVVDMVILLYRAEYYRLRNTIEDLEDDSTELIFAKNRNGSLRTIPLRYIEGISKFVVYEEVGFNQ